MNSPTNEDNNKKKNDRIRCVLKEFCHIWTTDFKERTFSARCWFLKTMMKSSENDMEEDETSFYLVDWIWLSLSAATNIRNG